MKKNASAYVLTIAGLILAGAGLYMIKALENSQGIMKALPYVCVGLGCGAFGHGGGALISRRVIREDPKLEKQIQIEQKDERNMAIANKAKVKAYDPMIFIFGALLISFALMGVSLTVVLLLVFAYLLVAGCSVYYHVKYSKEMQILREPCACANMAVI